MEILKKDGEILSQLFSQYDSQPTVCVGVQLGYLAQPGPNRNETSEARISEYDNLSMYGQKMSGKSNLRLLMVRGSSKINTSTRKVIDRILFIQVNQFQIHCAVKLVSIDNQNLEWVLGCCFFFGDNHNYSKPSLIKAPPCLIDKVNIFF